MASILIIDDDNDLRRILCERFRETGHDACGANGGDEALILIENRTVDLVITDIVMEDGEGIETIRRMRARTPHLPIIAISGHPDYLHYTEQFGVSRTIEKPFHMAKILEAMNELLEPPQTLVR